MSHAVCSVASSMSRPFAFAVLVPIFAAITAAILLGLLGVFVVWLCIVAVLITAIVANDVARRLLRRLAPSPIGTLQRTHSLDSTLRHEFLHMLIESQARPSTPLWLREGLAIYLSNPESAKPSKVDVDVLERQLHSLQTNGLRRSLSSGLLLRRREYARHPSGRMYRLRSLRAGMPGRCDQGRHRAGHRKMARN